MRNSLKLALSLAFAVPAAFGQVGIGPIHNSVASANQRVGTPNTLISTGFQLKTIAVGTDALENPSTKISHFGLLADGTRTEPDQNLYLVLDHVQGPTAGYNYGHHFLFQGHENAGDMAYVTRINLDVTDPDHRITLLTPEGSDGFTHFNSVDGSTYDPFSQTLFFTEEVGASGGVFQVSLTWPPVVTTLDGILGKAGYEGIHPDDRGNLLLVEDSGGTGVNVNPQEPSSPKTAKQPNSFVYRFVPKDPTDITKGGKLQALQVSINHQPVVFHVNDPAGDTFSTNQLLLHTPGTSYPVRWVTVHDTTSMALLRSTPTLPPKPPALPHSSVRKMLSFCPALTTGLSSSVPPATLTLRRATFRNSPRVAHGDRSSAWIFVTTGTVAASPFSCSETPRTLLLTTSRLPISTRFLPPKIAATCCTGS
jgi:hypothetical protein